MFTNFNSVDSDYSLLRDNVSPPDVFQMLFQSYGKSDQKEEDRLSHLYWNLEKHRE